MVVTHTQKSMNCKQSLFLQHLLQKSWLKFFFSKTNKYNDDNYRKKQWKNSQDRTCNKNSRM